MKKQIVSKLCLALLLAAAPSVYAQNETNPVADLSQTISDALFLPTSSLKLTPQEINLFANALLLLYMESHYTLRAHTSELSEQLLHRKEVIEKTCAACIAYIQEHGSASLQAIYSLLEHNTKSLKRTYLNKYQEELISGERDTFVHAQVLQQITINLFGLWYKTTYEGMTKNNFEADCFKIAFNQEGLIPAEFRSGQLPAPSALM